MWMQAFNDGIGFLAKHTVARNQRAWDKYNNAMVSMQSAQSQNSVTSNEALASAEHAERKLLIQTSRLQAAAKVQAGAAAAGVSGGAVEATLFDIGRNAGTRLAAERDQYDASLQVTMQQRRNIALQSKLAQRDLTKGPSLLAALGDFAADWQTEQETGSAGTQLEGRDTQIQPNEPWKRVTDGLML